MMIDRVHEHIVSELQQGARTDTIFVLIAVFLNLVMLAVSTSIASESREDGTLTIVLALFMVLTAVVNVVAVFGLLKGKETRRTLTHGLLKLYADQGVDGYYDPDLLKNYGTRYSLFILAIASMGAVAIVVPMVVR
jgi:hypothetical protein